MSLQDLFKARLTEQFINAKTVGSADLALRNGHYYIKKVNYKDFEKRGKIPIANVLWKSLDSDFFLKDVDFEVSLSGLNLESPLDYLNLGNKVILVTNTRIVTIEGGGRNIKRMHCEYSVVTQEPTFKSLQDLVLSTFMGNATTISEAYLNLQNDIKIDLSESIEFEVRPDEVYDEPTNDYSNEA